MFICCQIYFLKQKNAGMVKLGLGRSDGVSTVSSIRGKQLFNLDVGLILSLFFISNYPTWFRYDAAKCHVDKMQPKGHQVVWHSLQQSDCGVWMTTQEMLSLARIIWTNKLWSFLFLIAKLGHAKKVLSTVVFLWVLAQMWSKCHEVGLI